LAIADDGRGELVVEVPARVPDVRVRPRDPHLSLAPVAAAFLLAGQVPLRPPELLLRAPQEPRRADLGAVVQRREVGQAEVDPALAARLGQRLAAGRRALAMDAAGVL
jgi:hypothetical protein